MFQIYAQVVEETETKISALYKKYETENGLSPSDARKYIKGDEYSVWRKSMKDYLEDIKGAGANSDVAFELNTLAMKSRISREEKLLSELYREMYDMAEMQQSMMYECLEDVINTTYDRTNKTFLDYNAIKAGAKFEVYKLNQELIKEVLEYNWLEKTFSKAIWDNIDDLCANVKSIIAHGFTSGISVQKMTSKLVNAMGVGRFEADRLIRTECRFFANRGELMSYEANGVTRYIYKNGNSPKICDRCMVFNNVAILIKDAKPYVNFPPLHPYCKCFMCPYFDKPMFGNNEGIELAENVDLTDPMKIIKPKELKVDIDGDIIQLSMTRHSIERQEERGVTLDKIKNTIENYTIRDSGKTDKNGRFSQNYYSEVFWIDGKPKVTVVSVNPDKKSIPSVREIGKDTIKKENKRFKKEGIDFEFDY